jgi:hypothetical protein
MSSAITKSHPSLIQSPGADTSDPISMTDIAAAKEKAGERYLKIRSRHLLKHKLLIKAAAANAPQGAHFPKCMYSSGLQTKNQNKERRVTV